MFHVGLQCVCEREIRKDVLVLTLARNSLCPHNMIIPVVPVRDHERVVCVCVRRGIVSQREQHACFQYNRLPPELGERRRGEARGLDVPVDAHQLKFVVLVIDTGIQGNCAGKECTASPRRHQARHT